MATHGRAQPGYSGLVIIVLLPLFLSSSAAAALKNEPSGLDPSPALAAGVPAPAPAPADGLPCDGDPLCGNPVSVQWYQAHGWLMWLGFGVFMPLGIMTSRHLQTVTQHWFHIHISLMTLAIACIAAGAGIAFALFGAIPGTPPDDPAYGHITMGTAVFIMAGLNFLMGLARPHKGSTARVVWYFFHFAIGTTAVLLAWYTIFTGMNIYEENWVIDTGSGLPDLAVLKDLFTANIAIMGFVYLLLGRWEHLKGQGGAVAKDDGGQRFSSHKNSQQVDAVRLKDSGSAAEDRTEV